ncbi:MAG: quinoprotein relay system zinc metallohydrolase 2 [Acidiferrobacterales bacterium]|nr:quinoprotein relay system zinc metallohydrolase 2 [Acidiferrobacterales bacterium]
MHLLVLTITAFLAIQTAAVAHSHSEDECRSGVIPVPKVEEVADGIFLRESQFGQVFEQDNLANIGFIIGERCIAVIDTGGTPVEGKGLQCAIREQSSTPICYVINTHVHPDHLLGNQVFDHSNTEFVGHKNLARAISLLGSTYIERLREVAPDLESRLVPPTRIVETAIDLDLGNRILSLRAFPGAHTDNDITITDQRTKTIWTGDLLFSRHIPILGGSGSILGLIEATATIGEQSTRLMIPGHGPISTAPSRVIESQLQYLTELRDLVREWIADGGDIGPAVEQIGSSYPGLAMFDQFHKRNVSYTYTELEWE